LLLSSELRGIVITCQVVKRLNMMLGPGYYEAFEPMACNYIPGGLSANLVCCTLPVRQQLSHLSLRLIFIFSVEQGPAVAHYMLGLDFTTV
jgi:hypothetical protein